MHAFYSDTFVLPLPAGHRFPMPKYVLLRDRILSEGILPPEHIHIAEPATDEQLLRAHDADYIEKVRLGLLTPQEQRRFGFPWTPALAVRARCTVSATIMACRAALDMAAQNGFGVAANLAGGTHHAYRDHGQGYCVFNDSAVAARAMQAEGRARRVGSDFPRRPDSVHFLGTWREEFSVPQGKEQPRY
jgi:acetoin utilization deacetylase AcuC-like enzyme